MSAFPIERPATAIRRRLSCPGRTGRTVCTSALMLAVMAGCSPTAMDPLSSAPGGATATWSGPGADLVPVPQSRRTRVVVRLAERVPIEELTETYRLTLVDSEPALDLHLLAADDSTSELSLVTMLRGDVRIRFAEPDFAVHSTEGRQSSMAFDEGFRPFQDVVDQEALRRIGVPEAHARATGREVIIAILDTGVDLDHPALASRLVLPGFEPGRTVDAADDRAEQVDSNQDGLVDGSRGHGTHVAGVAAAVAPGARLLPVRVLDSDGVGYSFQVARGIVAAAHRGARVINLSLGMPVPSLAVTAALDYAVASGCVVVAPAGNGGEAALEFPAAHPPVVAIAATDALDRKAPFSNFDPGVDLSAPGVGILSTYFDGRYASWSGTSMAVPFVTGVAALVAEGIAPSPTGASQVIDRLRAGSSRLDAADPLYASGLGVGRVSATGSLSGIGFDPVDPELDPVRIAN